MDSWLPPGVPLEVWQSGNLVSCEPLPGQPTPAHRMVLSAGGSRAYEFRIVWEWSSK
jgi:hypothetical protein